MSWTQPCCEDCWRFRHDDRVPHRLVEAEQEICCYCGRTTTSGIYVREDPTTVPYPSKED